ncbi:MAG: hypothetical protein GYB65_12390, partial [Chloroflexi bacterium]|nr:hypothetical protein [Chloroflexota bacterium]
MNNRKHPQYLLITRLLTILMLGVLVLSSLSITSPASASEHRFERGRYSIVGDPNFDPNNLPPDIRLWYDRSWAAISNGRTYPDPDRAAESGDLYRMGRTLNAHVTALSVGLRVTGDLSYLDEIDRLMQITRGTLHDYNGDGYLNWRWLLDSNSMYYNNDHHKMDEMFTATLVASAAYALKSNEQFDPLYGQHADFWIDYLENHFLAKWESRGGIEKSLTHAFADFTRFYLYMYYLTGDQAYLTEANRRAGVLDNMMVRTNTGNGIAFTWDHRVPNMGKNPYGCQPTVYGISTLMTVQELALEGFNVYADNNYMAHYATTFRELVMRYGTTKMSGDVCGSGEERITKFMITSIPGLSLWDDTGELFDLSVRIFEENENDDNPQGVIVPIYIMLALSEGSPSPAPTPTPEPATNTPTRTPTLIPNPTDQPQPTATTPATPLPTIPPPVNGRVTANLQALYTFDEGGGSTVNDVSGVGTPLNLTISDPGAVSWQAGYLSVTGSTIIASAGSASKLIDGSRASNELTIEAWIVPANTSQDGPARIVTLSQDLYTRNFTLGQGSYGVQPSDFYDVRLRTTSHTTNGMPSLSSNRGTLSTSLTHVVYTRDVAGNARLYINGVEQQNGNANSTLVNWDTGYRFALANEFTGNRPWRGDFHLVAIYNRALSSAEVSQNYSAGSDGDEPVPTPTPEPTDVPPPTATFTPLPTDTPTRTPTLVPTETALPPTNTPEPATDTPVPPTDVPPTDVPPTDVPPTATFTPLPPTATNTPVPPTAVPNDGRVTAGLQALYTFDEGSGNTVNDVSGVGAPLNLTISDTNAVNWQSGQLSVTGSTIIASSGPATKLIDGSRASNELSIEAWIVPANTSQDGPARIVTLSQDLYKRNFTLGQGYYGVQPANFYDVRLRSTSQTTNGMPSLASPRGALTTTLTHVVYTRDANGNVRLYVNGVQQQSGTVSGSLANWDTGFRFGLANEFTGNRPWFGDFHLVAVYSRALSSNEVNQNFTAGADGENNPVPTPEPTQAPPTNTPVPPTDVPPTDTPPTDVPPPATFTPTLEPTVVPPDDGTGLWGEYFNATESSTLGMTRTDPTIDFDWAYGAPDAAISADYFAVRWTGYVVPLYSETYTFYTQSDDGVRLWVNDQLLIDNWTMHGLTEDTGTIDLVAGQPYSIRLDYFEDRAHAVIKLLWSSASQPQQIIPAAQLFHGEFDQSTPTPEPTQAPTDVPPTATFTPLPPTATFAPTVEPTAEPTVEPTVEPTQAPTVIPPTATFTPTATPPAEGEGLLGQYYDNIDFTNRVLERADATIDFDWGYGAPDAVMESDSFTIRWTGYVVPLYTETYTFYTQSDDGARLWIDDQLVIDDWEMQDVDENSATIDLMAGQPYSIRLEFYDDRAHAVIKLLWSSASQPKQIVPAAQLSHNPPDDSISLNDITPQPPGPAPSPQPPDGIEQLQVVQAETPAVLKSGTWTGHTTGLANGGGYVYSSGSTDDILTLSFMGDHVAVVYVQHPALGSFAIEVDGVVLQTVNGTASDTIFGAQVLISGLSTGQHTLRLLPVAGTFAIDAILVPQAIIVQPDPTPAPTQAPPTELPPVEPTTEPPVDPTTEPPSEPTAAPVDDPTLQPTQAQPTVAPTVAPTVPPTAAPTSTPLPVSLPFSDGFDGGSQWTATSLWRSDSQYAMGGSAWVADSSQRGQIALLEYGPAIQLNAARPQLTFWQRAMLTPADRVGIEISLDGGATW